MQASLQPHPRWLRWLKTSPRTSVIVLAMGAMLLSACAGIDQTTSTPTGNGTAGCNGKHTPTQPTGSGDLGTPISSGSPIGPVPDDQHIHLNIALAVNQAALDSCLDAIRDPSSADYHHFLSPQDIAQNFAPASSDIAKVTNFMTSKGLTVSQTYTTNAALSVDGNARQVDDTFSITLQQYQKGNRTVFAPDKTATLPGDVKNFVQSINGLSTESAVHCNVSGGDGKTNCGSSLIHHSHFPTPPAKPRVAPKNGADCTFATLGTPGLSGGINTTPLLTWSELRSAYGLNNLASKGFTGKGTSIGMVEFDTYDPNDVVNYMLCADSSGFKTSSAHRITNEVVVPGGAAPDSGPGAGEATLDMEMSAGMTTADTQIINYYAPNNDQWEASFEDMLQKAASEKKVSVLSISYGSSENSMSPTYMNAVNDTMKLLAAEGISVFVASGDCGPFASAQFGEPALSFPASAPYAIAVGGTDLTTDPLSGNRQSEKTWINSSPDHSTCQNTWGSGGGLSSVGSFTTPKWQTGTGVTNQYSNGHRQVPDVSAAAINISFYYSGFWLPVGGTSAAAPIWATGIDVVNQDLAASKKQPFGAVPAVYTLANGGNGSKAFNDITDGPHLYNYAATKGWDFVTGWGSPNFDKIASALGG